jgi:hypothetical protein
VEQVGKSDNEKLIRGSVVDYSSHINIIQFHRKMNNLYKQILEMECKMCSVIKKHKHKECKVFQVLGIYFNKQVVKKPEGKRQLVRRKSRWGYY